LASPKAQARQRSRKPITRFAPRASFTGCDTDSRQAALAHHPDKVAEDQREEAEVRFKSAKQAYEILNDDDKRHLYDTHGMSAFDPSNGMGGGGPDMDDIFAQMFGGMGGMGGGFGGMPGMGGMPRGGRNVPRKGRSVEQEYEVSLEELYKGKTTKFSNTKNIVCSMCKGSGGKQGAKSNACSVCNGQGMFIHFGQRNKQNADIVQVSKQFSVKLVPDSSPKKLFPVVTVLDPDRSFPRSIGARSARARRSLRARTS
jgi:curved DNA-binding protein CbpA